MKFLIQRVTEASVVIEGQEIAKIGRGYLVLIGACDADTEETAAKMVRKMLALRIFADETGKTNLALQDVQGSLLLVSQFTLYADCRKGNRPSFLKAGSPSHAEELYRTVVRICREAGYPVQTGSFGADMQVRLCNDGPFTIFLDSAEL